MSANLKAKLYEIAARQQENLQALDQLAYNRQRALEQFAREEEAHKANVQQCEGAIRLLIELDPSLATQQPPVVNPEAAAPQEAPQASQAPAAPSAEAIPAVDTIPAAPEEAING